jgi:hypothetical protein
MKRFKAQKTYFALVMLILGVLFIAGCGSDEAALLTAHDYKFPGECAGASPTVNSSDPFNGANPVALDTNITATFSEAMDPTTTADAFTLWDGLTQIAGTVTLSDDGMVATFNPTNNLELGTLYAARITKHAENVGGTSLSCDYEWKFTTVAPD